MWSSCIALLIVSVALNVANSHNYAPRTAYHQLLTRSVKKEINKFELHADGCGEDEFSRSAKAVLMRGICNKPRDTIVPVTPEDPSTEFFPSYVEVQRCQGMCSRTQACLPSKVEIKEIPVRRKSADDQQDCGFVHVEEHVRCKCGCAVMEEHCNKLQEYSANECMCECKNKEDKDVCVANGRVWNMDSCGCDCPESDMECSSGLEWVPSMCKCMKVM